MKQHIKRKFSLGKRNNRVSVFLKNKKTRRKVQDELKNLQRKPIEEIKEYINFTIPINSMFSELVSISRQ